MIILARIKLIYLSPQIIMVRLQQSSDHKYQYNTGSIHSMPFMSGSFPRSGHQWTKYDQRPTFTRILPICIWAPLCSPSKVAKVQDVRDGHAVLGTRRAAVCRVSTPVPFRARSRRSVMPTNRTTSATWERQAHRQTPSSQGHARRYQGLDAGGAPTMMRPCADPRSV
jgi:hypothetical protein